MCVCVRVCVCVCVHARVHCEGVHSQIFDALTKQYTEAPEDFLESIALDLCL